MNSFNGRDQVVSAREIAGSENSGNYQEMVATYDGHGRLKTRHRPEQDTSKSTAYDYYADDKVHSVIDANGGRETYTYDSRGLHRRTDYDLITPQNIDNLTPIMHGLDNGGPSNRYRITIKGNNFGSDVVVKINDGMAGPTQYQGSQLERYDSNGEQFIAFTLVGGDTSRLTNPPGIYVAVQNSLTNKKSSNVLIRVTLADVLPPLHNLEYTNVSDIRSTAIIPEAILQTPSVSFEYDNAGNTTRMTDGMGEQVYEYDQLSRLKSETRNFNEQLPAQVTPPNGFKIQYQYGLTGQLTKITDPYGDEVSYNHDKVSRLSGVSGFQSDTQTNLQYVTEANYTAFGAPKKLVYGNNTSIETEYNDRIQPKKTSLKDLSSNNASEFEYQYNADGKIKFSNEHGYFPGKDGTDLSIFDRSFDYDFAGRMTSAKTGAEAHGQTETDFTKRPYRATYDWDTFGHLTKADKFHWTETYPQEPVTFVDERETVVTVPPSPYPPRYASITTPLYDSEGRKKGTSYVTTSDNSSFELIDWEATYDIAGRRVRNRQKKHLYDGNGRILKSSSETVPSFTPMRDEIAKSTESKYFIYSTVLGEVINEVGVYTWDSRRTQHADGWPDYYHAEASNKSTDIFAGGSRIARTSGVVTQINLQNATGTFYQEKTLAVRPGTPSPNLYIATNSMELDPFHAAVGEKNPYPAPGEPPPDNGCGGAIWQDGEWGNAPLCDDSEGDPSSDEDADIGNVPANTCIVNGFEQEDCRVVANHPDMYETDNGPFRLITDKDGHRSLALNSDNSPNALTSSGRWVKQHDGNSIKIDGKIFDYPSAEYLDFVADDQPDWDVVATSWAAMKSNIERVKKNNPELLGTISSNSKLTLGWWAICHAAIESSLDPNAKGKAGEKGLFQLKWSTAKAFAPEVFGVEAAKNLKESDLFDPSISTQIGTYYVKYLSQKFGVSQSRAMGIFKLGEGNYDARDSNFTKKTSEYVEAIRECIGTDMWP